MRAKLGYGLVLAGLTLVVSACTAVAGDEGSSESAISSPATLGGFHAMPLMSQSAREAAPAATPAPVQLKYYGGPVLANVVVHAVYWGNTVAFQSHVNDFYGMVTQSSFMDWLSEYNTPTQNVGRGSFAGATVITPSHTGTSLKDADIQAELSAQMDGGHLPQSDGKNDLYMIHFPPGVKITAPDGQSQSCVQFCAYHGTYVKGSGNVYYGIMPDLAQSGCNQGCGGSTAQENTTSVASHEMVEAITDAAVGLATTYGPPLAWYNQQQGEIGDICNGQQGQVNGFTVQKQWSNHQNKCVTGAAQ
jgi:hypothetical protein